MNMSLKNLSPVIESKELTNNGLSFIYDWVIGLVKL